MNLRYYFLFIFLISFICAKGQLEDNIWYFGSTPQGILFDFSTNQPTVVNNQYTPYGNEGCTVSTNPATGQLFFYSDGIRVVDRSHKVMPNGNGLLGLSSSAQSGWACPFPGNCSKYYVFSNYSAYEINSGGTLYYSIVDMSLPGNGTSVSPLGDIQTGAKNVSIISNTSEALLLINGTVKGEYWLLSHQYSSSIIRVLKINTSGITLSASYNIGATIRDARCLSYSGVSKKICILGQNGLDPIVVSDFDNSTGVISNSKIIPGTPFLNQDVLYYGPYDMEWSSDGTKLYISVYRWYQTSSGGRLYQYDLNQPTSAPVLIFNNGGTISNMCRGLKRGPDNKIYLLYNSSAYNSTRYIGIVNNPNNSGTSCDFNAAGLDMGSDLGGAHKFPDILPYNNRKPIAINDYITDPNCLTVNENTIIDVLLNDSDPDNDNLNISILNVKYGSATISPDKKIQYITPLNYVGNDTISYTISDDVCYPLYDTAKVIICINPVCNNNKPVAENDTLSICLSGGMNGLIDFLSNDSDPDGDNWSYDIIQKSKGEFNILPDSMLSYTAPYLFSGRDSIVYAVCDHSCNILCDTATISFCVCYIDIFIPDLITPNRDNKNDHFEIKGLYPNSFLQIYNRWGEKVYQNDNYNNEWGSSVTDGVYYYFFSDPIRQKEWKGWIHVLSKDK